MLMLSTSMMDSLFAECTRFSFRLEVSAAAVRPYPASEDMTVKQGQGCLPEPRLTLGTKVNSLSILPFLACAFSYCDNGKIYRTKAKVWEWGRATTYELLASGLNGALRLGPFVSPCELVHQGTLINMEGKSCSKKEDHVTEVFLCVY